MGESKREEVCITCSPVTLGTIEKVGEFASVRRRNVENFKRGSFDYLCVLRFHDIIFAEAIELRFRGATWHTKANAGMILQELAKTNDLPRIQDERLQVKEPTALLRRKRARTKGLEPPTLSSED